MQPVGLSSYALAKALDVSLPRVNNVVRKKRSISPKMAVLRSAYFGTSDGYWINLQAHFDLEMAKEKVGRQAPVDALRLGFPPYDRSRPNCGPRMAQIAFHIAAVHASRQRIGRPAAEGHDARLRPR
jgi:addiction module HigA family antidote